jgi:uncharacterized protein
MQDSPTKVPVKVLPGASRNEIAGLQNGVWRIKIAAPADKGKANKELIDYLSEIMAIKKVDITILKGQTSHNKIIAVEGLSPAEVNQRLTAGQ